MQGCAETEDGHKHFFQAATLIDSPIDTRRRHECDCDCDCDDDFCDCCDDDEFEVECPLCNEVFTVDGDTVMEGSINCPNCGEKLEFEMCECDEEDEDEE